MARGLTLASAAGGGVAARARAGLKSAVGLHMRVSTRCSGVSGITLRVAPDPLITAISLPSSSK